MTQPAPLKPYEREIRRARSRVDVADLDDVIDKLIAVIIGKLTRAEYKTYQASRLQSFLGNPNDIVERRAFLMHLVTTKGISAPDVLTMEEEASLVVIMENIADWLRECQANDRDIDLQDLIMAADRISVNALRTFEARYHRAPLISDVPKDLMRVSRARTIKRIADSGGVMLPPPTEE